MTEKRKVILTLEVDEETYERIQKLRNRTIPEPKTKSFYELLLAIGISTCEKNYKMEEGHGSN